MTNLRDKHGRHRVVVTGMGAHTPAGTTLASMWSRLISGASCAARIERYDPSALTVQIGCEVRDFDSSPYLNPKEARRLDRVAQLGFAAAADALAHAGTLNADPAMCAVVAGVGIGGLITLEEQIENLITRGPRTVSPMTVPMMMPNATSALVSMQFGWTGPNTTVATACAAGTNAIGDAAQMIRYGESTVVLALGAESCMTPVSISAFGRMTALSNRNDEPSIASRPFDAARDGFVMGEGAGALVLESLEHALARGATVHAELVGYGRNSDAHHITAPSPGGIGAAACMQLALNDASLQTSDIVHINAHGTSTPLNDSAEAEAISKTFAGAQPVVTSTKGVTGHMIGAAGAVEAIAAILAMGEMLVPPTANLDNLDPAINLLIARGTAMSIERGAVMSNSFGFGGHNASLIFAPVET